MPDLPKVFGKRSPAPKRGGSSTRRDNTQAFKRMREDVLRSHPLCLYCEADRRVSLALVVDHIVALSLGGSNDRSNLAPACRACNDAKAADERRFADKGFDPRDIERDPVMSDWIRKARSI